MPKLKEEILKEFEEMVIMVSRIPSTEKVFALDIKTSTPLKNWLSSKLDEIEKEVIVKDDLLETAWGIICNVSEGDLTKQNAEWHNAFERYREEYFKTLATTPPSKLSEKN